MAKKVNKAPQKAVIKKGKGQAGAKAQSAKKSGKNSKQGKKKVPNPNGKKGCDRHQQKINEIKPAKGNTLKKEVPFDTSNSKSGKQKRYADAVEYNKDGEIVKIYQVGKKNKKPDANNNVVAVARERKAKADIEGSSQCPPGLKVTFIPYN